MRLKFFEVSNGFNYGKFAVGTFDGDELAYQSLLDATMGVQSRLIQARGWGPDHRLVLDLQTGEAAMFRLGGYAKADLMKRRIWTCPMFPAFLEVLYRTPDIETLPALIELTEDEAPSSMQGWRWPGEQDPFVEFT